MKKTVLSIFSLAVILISCGKRDEIKRTERIYDVDVNMENDFINIENTKRQYNAHSGDYFSSVDSVAIYGAGYVKTIHDSLKGYNLNVCVSAWVREFSAPCEGIIAASLNKDNSVIDWKNLQPNANNFKEKEWNYITDTIKYNSSQINEATVLKIFSMKQAGKDFLDVDDLRIKYIFYK